MSENANPTVIIETSMGNITLELDAVNAPISTENFVAYANDGFYEGTIFHRVIDGFMVQGGGLTADMRDKDNKKGMIKNEAGNGLKNDLGTVAMARTNVVDSATSSTFLRDSCGNPARASLIPRVSSCRVVRLLEDAMILLA